VEPKPSRAAVPSGPLFCGFSASSVRDARQPQLGPTAGSREETGSFPCPPFSTSSTDGCSPKVPMPWSSSAPAATFSIPTTQAQTGDSSPSGGERASRVSMPHPRPHATASSFPRLPSASPRSSAPSRLWSARPPRWASSRRSSRPSDDRCPLRRPVLSRSSARSIRPGFVHHFSTLVSVRTAS
jgi:hypothetical protein